MLRKLKKIYFWDFFKVLYHNFEIWTKSEEVENIEIPLDVLDEINQDSKNKEVDKEE